MKPSKKRKPLLARRFDTTTALYRDRDDAEPMLSCTLRGNYRVDLCRVGALCLALGGTALLLGIAAGIKRNR